MAKTKTNKKRTTPVKKKRDAYTLAAEKIKNGEPWRYTYDIGKDVAPLIIKEVEKNFGANIGKILDARIADSYKNNPELK